MDLIAMDEIRKGIAMLYVPGDVIEVRIPRKHGTEFSPNISGYFTDHEKLAYAINYANTKYESTVYTMMNPIKPSWMAANNKLYVGSKTMHDEIVTANLPLEPRMKKSVLWETGKTHWAMRMAEDGDILRRRWILIDVDAGQPANTNSSDEEHAMTRKMAEAIIAHLTERGFPKPALSNSGNGHHVYVRVNLENDGPALALVRRFLKALSQRFTGYGTAHIDEGMFNAGRITKATGSFVYKGEDTPERPRRRSQVIEFASKKYATIEQLTEIAEEYVMKPGESFDMWDSDGVAIANEEMATTIDRAKSILDFYGIDYRHIVQSGSDLVLPCTCPNENEHSMDGGEFECVTMIAQTGALSFCCQHSHCQELRSWKGMRAFMEKKTGKVFGTQIYLGENRLK